MPSCAVLQDLAGKTAQEIFSTDLFIQEIKKAALDLQLDVSSLEEKSLPLHLEHCLAHKDSFVRQTAQSILKLFGERLAVILLCLKEGNPANRAARPDWKEEHWKYWNYLETIVLVGGLASPPLGELLKHYMEEVFHSCCKFPYQIVLGQDSTYAGLRGCGTFLPLADIGKEQVSLIFDYGQSFIKRSYMTHSENGIRDIIILEKTLSQHVEWDITEEDCERKEAAALNNYFLHTIADTVKEVEERGCQIHDHIVLSIANYVDAGVIANRGGYGKLRLIAPNYGDYLEEQLYKLTNKRFHFTLVHDGTAMAAGYANYSRCVCVSLGTAFGVGFPLSEPALNEKREGGLL